MKNFSFRSFFLVFAAFFPFFFLSSCTGLKDKEQAGPKIYAPGEIRAEDIERIAMSEAGLREGVEMNYRSRGVTDREDVYYVSLVARPYKPGAVRTVGVNSRGEVVDYLKGDKIPAASRNTSPAPKPSAILVPAIEAGNGSSR